MDIQKEREAFEKEMLNSRYVAGNISAFWDKKTQDYDIAITELRMAWHAWQAAKAQTVPDLSELQEMIAGHQYFHGEHGHMIVDMDDVIKEISGFDSCKAQAVPEGFVLVEKAKIKTWFQDDDEPENFCSEESEIADLADPYETGEIIKINRIEDCVISVTPLYGTWKIDRIDQEGDVHRSFVLCDSYYEAEKVIVSNKEVDDEWLLAQQAQEPTND